jgi:hypothetical protein
MLIALGVLNVALQGAPADRIVDVPRGAAADTRVDAKRQALDALDVRRGLVLPAPGKSGGNGNGDGAEIKVIAAVTESVTSQFAFAGVPVLR